MFFRLSLLEFKKLWIFEEAKFIVQNSQFRQILIIPRCITYAHSDETVKTDIYLKDTNLQDYLLQYRAHPDHCKINVRCNPCKRIVTFFSDEKKVGYKPSKLNLVKKLKISQKYY